MRHLIRARRWLRRLRGADPEWIVTGGAPPSDLTPTQTMFLRWNAERLKISMEESRARYLTSWAAIRDGHAGPDYRRFSMLSHRLFQVFFDDSEREVSEAYRLHGPMHFLRMLSYPDAKWDDRDILVQRLRDRSRIDILDYGCGLAQSSRGLARYLQGRGMPVRLVLVDIPTLRKAFLLWLGNQVGVDTTFIDSDTPSLPVLDLPPCDVCFAQEFFEHVHDPLRYFEAIHSALKPRGMLVTNVADHDPEFMHVSPRLSELRARLGSLGYDELRPHILYQKP